MKTKKCVFCGVKFKAYRYHVGKFCCSSHYQLYRTEHKLTREERNTKQRLNNYKIKILVLSYYSNGKPKCLRCGVEDIDILCLDHISGGGTKQRLDTRLWGAKLHHYLIRNHFPLGFQVLCANCNLKKFVVEGL